MHFSIQQLFMILYVDVSIHFHQPGPVQLLLGADVYEDLFLDERKKAHRLHYRKSIFGWVVTEVLGHVRPYQFQSFQVAVELDLARFWKVEEIPRVKPISKDNRQCVEHYDTTTYVADDGRITVRLPFKNEAVPQTTFKQQSRDCSPWSETSRITVM